MLCDELARSLSMRPPGSQPRPDLRHAELIRMSGCPARPGFRELHFNVWGRPWSWCFPPAGRDATAASRIDLTVVADLAVSGTPVFVRYSLLGQGSADDVHDGGRPAAGMAGFAR